MLDEAIVTYQRAKDLCPMNATVHASLAFATHLAGRQHEAIELYHAALVLKPNFAFAVDMLQIVRVLQNPFKEVLLIDSTHAVDYKALREVAATGVQDAPGMQAADASAT